MLQEHTKELMSLQGVAGIAIGKCDDQPCIKVYVIYKTKELMQRIPSTLGGYTVSIEEGGKFRALST